MSQSPPVLDSLITGTIKPECFDRIIIYRWDPPITGPPTSYTLTVSPNPGGSPYSITGTNTSQTLTGLTNGTNYSASITATTGANTSVAVSFRTVQPGFLSERPIVVRGYFSTPTSAIIKYSSPLSNLYVGQTASTKWYVLTCTSNTTTFNNSRLTGKTIRTTNSNIIYLEDLNSNSTYSFTLQSVNDVGYSSYQTNIQSIGQIIVDTDLILRLESWTYNGGSTWFDSSSCNNNATLSAGTGVSSNGYVYFNGTTYFRTINNFSKLDNWTLSLWFMTTSQIYTGTVNLLGQALTNTSYGIVNVSPSNYKGYSFSNGTSLTTPSMSPLPYTWNQLVTTWDGTLMKLYSNGGLVGTNTYTGYIQSTYSSTICIGGQTIFFNGLIGQALIYKRALTQAEVTCNYNATLGNFTYANDIFFQSNFYQPWDTKYLVYQNSNSFIAPVAQSAQSTKECFAISKIPISLPINNYYISCKIAPALGNFSLLGITSNTIVDSGFSVSNGYRSMIPYGAQAFIDTITIFNSNVYKENYTITGLYGLTVLNELSINFTPSNVQYLVDSNTFFVTETPFLGPLQSYYTICGIPVLSATLSNIRFDNGNITSVNRLNNITNAFTEQQTYFVSTINNITLSGGPIIGTYLKYTNDGSNWSDCSFFSTNGIQYVPSGYYAGVCMVSYSPDKDLFVCTGIDGLPSETQTRYTVPMKYSRDGINWSDAQSGITFGLSLASYNVTQGTCIDYGVDKWVVGGYNPSGGSSISYSINGSNWSNAINVSSVNVNTVLYRNNLWLAGLKNSSNSGFTNSNTFGSTIMCSVDGITWSNTQNAMYRNTYAIGYDGNVWVAVGDDSGGPTPCNIKLSKNGSNWSNAANAYINIGISVEYLNNLWISQSEGGISISKNGSNWSNTNNGMGRQKIPGGFTINNTNINTNMATNSIGYSNGIYIAMGGGVYDSSYRYSKNGSNWSNYRNNIYGFQITGTSVTFRNDQIVMCGTSYRNKPSMICVNFSDLNSL